MSDNARQKTRLRLILVDPVRELCAAWKRHFKGLRGVRVVNGRFENLPEFDCLTSAANSFGLMDGGVDLAIVGFFGIELMDRVQARIVDEYLGEQPVGTSLIVETGHPRHPFVAHTPTMRVPMPITRTDNVYTAMWALLVAIDRHNRTAERKIESLACPGLGTATGRVPPDEAARQMALAYRHFLFPPTLMSWPYAHERQQMIRYGGDAFSD
ncbi:MAG: macro domain-containing protein [Acidobacteria bacterium]|nr:macro domain-containing protein [Acidobacteriota bacterium]